MATETLVEALDRLAAAGYRDDFRVEAGGLRARRAGTFHRPESLVIEEIVRFEGETDPGEEAALFALRADDGFRGTYTVAYGPAMDLRDAEIVSRLRVGHRSADSRYETDASRRRPPS